jgi:hypothetical protein
MLHFFQANCSQGLARHIEIEALPHMHGILSMAENGQRVPEHLGDDEGHDQLIRLSPGFFPLLFPQNGSTITYTRSPIKYEGVNGQFRVGDW